MYYFLSQDTAGAITPTQPASGLAQRILFVEDADTIHIDIEPAGQAVVDSQVFSATSRLVTSFWGDTAHWPAGGIAPISNYGQPFSIGGRFEVFDNKIIVKAGGRVRLTGPQGMMSDGVGYNRHFWALAGTTVPYKPTDSNSQSGFAISPNMNFHWSPATAILEFTPAVDTELIIYSADSSAGFRLNADFGLISCEEIGTQQAGSPAAASAATVPWTEVTPGGGWSNGDVPNRTTLGYKNVNGVVHLKGWVTGGSTNGGFLMTLPVGSRPTGLGATQQLELRVGGDPDQGRLFVGNDGNVFVYALPGGTSVLTFDGLSFPIDY
jgi:hypothetical protein